MSPKHITIGEVRSSFNRAVSNHWSVTWFGRPLANVMTPFFYNSGWTANQVTLARTVISLLGLIALCLGTQLSLIFAVIAFYFGFVLDCVDGNISRLHTSVSYWGKFIDGLSDSVFVTFAAFATGIGIWRQEGDDVWLLVGALITVLSLTCQAVRNRLSFFREWMVSQSGPLTKKETKHLRDGAALETKVTAVIVNGTFIAPAILIYPGTSTYYLIVLAIVQGLMDSIWIGVLLLQARAILRRGRKSIHAAPAADRSGTEQ